MEDRTGGTSETLVESEVPSAAMIAEIENMKRPGGFDVVIVCCSNLAAEDFWQARLEQTIEETTGTAAIVLCVHEDWDGGAGNGLGTLYAFRKACAKGATSGVDLAQRLRDGAAVAIYHTAGKGTRLAPLPGSENNNKPGVKLPGLLTIGGELQPITVLESVLRQTSSYSAVRGGRCSVFWGDQIFVPSRGIQASERPADILAALRPMPTAEEWAAEQLHQYGLIAVDSRGDATQLEKVTFDVATSYLPADVQQVGTSLGSFSVTAALLEALLEEFARELDEKTGSLDSDPHFWMPLTLKLEDYQGVMGKKGVSSEESGAHYARMAAFKERLAVPGGSILGCVDVGRDAYWWDYGRLELYMANNRVVTESSESARALRVFFGLEEVKTPREDFSGRRRGSSLHESVVVDDTAVVLGCRLGGGRVGAGSVLVNVAAPSVDVENCVLVNITSAAPLVSHGGLLYNVVHESEDPLEQNDVRADVFMPGGVHHVMVSALSIDGGKVWKQQLDGNPMSFEGIYLANQPLDVGECSREASAAHLRLRSASAL